MRRLFNLAREERGAAVIELALVAPMFALMVIGIVDISNAFSRKLALEQGAQRAIEKIMQTTEEDTVEGTLKSEAVCQVNGMNGNGSCKTSPITVNDVTVTYRLECVTVGTGSFTVQTSTDPVAFDLLTCPVGTRDTRYLEVGVVDKYTPMFPVKFSAINSDGTYHISATAGMRTQ